MLIYVAISNVDIAVSFKNGVGRANKENIRRLADVLRRWGPATDVFPVLNGKSPTIRFLMENYNVCISLNGSQVSSAVEWAQDQQYAHPVFSDLVLLVKSFFLARNLTVAKEGGISSNVIMSLVSAFIKVNHRCYIFRGYSVTYFSKDPMFQKETTSLSLQLRHFFDWISTYPFKTRTLVLDDPSCLFIHRLENDQTPVSILSARSCERATFFAYLLY